MQLGDREKSSIIITLTLNIILVIIFIFIGFYNAYGKYINIELQKTELLEVVNSISGLKSDGITFEDFIKLKSSNKYVKTEYLNFVLKNITSDFYINNFINKKGGKFEDFLINKGKALYDNDTLLALTEEKLVALDDDIEEKVRNEKSRKEKIITILPSYKPELNLVDDNLLTDFKFINYVESIINTFNLEVNTAIGIGDISAYTNGLVVNNKKNKKNTLVSKIFYIPISFSVTGKKKNILNFIHYIENVGNITVNDGNFEVLNDKVLFYPDNRKIILTGDYNKIFGNGKRYRTSYKSDSEFIEDYNIYNHQLIDLESISMKNYPVKYYIGEVNGGLSFDDFLKSNIQREDKFAINVKLRFYIKGVPNYKMIEFIKSYISDFKTTKNIVASKFSELSKDKESLKNGKNILLKNQFEKSNNYLNGIDEEVKKIELTLKKGIGIDKIYKNVVEYKLILKNIKTVLGLSDESEDEIIEK